MQNKKGEKEEKRGKGRKERTQSYDESGPVVIFTF